MCYVLYPFETLGLERSERIQCQTSLDSDNQGTKAFCHSRTAEEKTLPMLDLQAFDLLPKFLIF